jgi:hypothetical protein
MATIAATDNNIAMQAQQNIEEKIDSLTAGALPYLTPFSNSWRLLTDKMLIYYVNL